MNIMYLPNYVSGIILCYFVIWAGSGNRENVIKVLLWGGNVTGHQAEYKVTHAMDLQK